MNSIVVNRESFLSIDAISWDVQGIPCIISRLVHIKITLYSRTRGTDDEHVLITMRHHKFKYNVLAEQSSETCRKALGERSSEIRWCCRITSHVLHVITPKYCDLTLDSPRIKGSLQ